MPNIGFEDTFFEERFHPSKPVFDEQTLCRLRESPDTTKKFTELRHLEFVPSLNQTTVQYLKKLVKAQVEFGALHGFLLRDANHPVKFTDSATYEQETGNSLPKNIPLPASRLDYLPVSKVFSVTVVLPNDLDPSKVRVNLTRTLFSKLFGEIHFQEKILPQEFFQNRLKNSEDPSTNIPAILELLNTLEFPSKKFSNHCEVEANANGLNNPKDPKETIHLKITKWKKQWEEKELGSTETNLLQTIYFEFVENLKRDPATIYQQTLKRVRDFDKFLNLILPHDNLGYLHFEKENPLQFLRSYANRLEESLSLIGFLEEVEQQFKQMKDKELLQGLHMAINKRMRDMRKEGKARPYLFPELEQTDTMKRLAAKFPLKMMKWLPQGSPLDSWNKELQKMLKQYTQSLYAKLYLALDAMDKQILDKLDNPSKPSDTELRFNSLISHLRLRTKQVQQWRSVLGIIVDTGEGLPDSHKQKGFSLYILGKAWSYLLSTLLTLEFFLNDRDRDYVPEDFQSDKYLGLIHRFIHLQASQGINSYHVVSLLLTLYEKTPEKPLEFLHYCLQNPLPTLKYVLDRIMAPLTKDESIRKRLDQMPLHSDTLFQSLYCRWQASVAKTT